MKLNDNCFLFTIISIDTLLYRGFIMSGYKVGTWLIHRRTKDLFEITEYMKASYHTGPDRCIIVLRSKQRSKYTRFNLAINLIREDFEVTPAAQLLYSNVVTRS